MLTVALDTCFQAGGVAVADGPDLLGEVLVNTPGTHSRRLLTELDFILERAGAGRADIGGVAVTRGPGFFTGLRIGFATALGLAVGLEVPAVGISTLRLLAHGTAREDGLIWAVGDARRGLLYAGSFQARGGELHRVEADMAVSPEKLAPMIEAPALLVGPGARLLPQPLAPGLELAPAWADMPRPGLLALLGADMLARGLGGDPGGLRPGYCRPSDAEVRFGLPLDEYRLIE